MVTLFFELSVGIYNRERVMWECSTFWLFEGQLR